MANGSLVLAVAGELALPALLPASAVLLVASSLKVLREAWREVCRRKLGLPVLFSTILAGTLLSGQFLAAALMAWMYQFWRHQHRAAQHRLRRQLLPSLTQRPAFRPALRRRGRGRGPDRPAARRATGSWSRRMR